MQIIILTTRGLYYKKLRIVIYVKWTDFLVSQCLFHCQSLSLDWTNLPSFYRICKLRIPNIFIVQGPDVSKLNVISVFKQLQFSKHAVPLNSYQKQLNLKLKTWPKQDLGSPLSNGGIRLSINYSVQIKANINIYLV